MISLLIKTKDFMHDFCIDELKDILKKNLEVLDYSILKADFDSYEDLCRDVYEILHYSRTVERVLIYLGKTKNIDNLDISENSLSFINNKLKFEVDCIDFGTFSKLEGEKIIGRKILEANPNLEVDLENFDLSFKVFELDGFFYLGLDCINFKLTRRDWRVNISGMSVNPLVSVYLFYLMGLQKEKNKKATFLDPHCNMGDMILESSIFSGDIPLNLKNRLNIPLLKVFDFRPKIPSKGKSKWSFFAVVRDNKIFRQVRENINFSGQKIKLSQYEFDWLDVKYKKGDITYCISQFPIFYSEKEKDDYEKEFFYQCEFVCKKKIGVIARKEINEKWIKKYKLIILEKRKVHVGKQNYIIYSISH